MVRGVLSNEYRTFYVIILRKRDFRLFAEIKVLLWLLSFVLLQFVRPSVDLAGLFK